MKRLRVGTVVAKITLGLGILLILPLQQPVFGQFAATEVIQAGQAAGPISTLSPAQLDSLVAPIALYPDPLLSQVLVASTYPLEVVQAAQWLQRNPTLVGAALQDAARQQNWDPSIQALVVFPDLLNRLSENAQWTTDLGGAFLDQQAGVMDAVQRMRSQAMASGKLASNGEALVRTQSQGNATVVEIQPASSQVIYVPVYDPFAIWGPASYPYPVLYRARAPIVVRTAPVYYTSGVFVGPLFVGWSGWGGWGWQPNWFGRTVVVNNGFFNRYGYDRYYGRDRIVVANRVNGPVIWTHNPVHRGNIPYSNRGLTSRAQNDFRRPVEGRPQTVGRSPAGGFAPNDSRPEGRRVIPASPTPGAPRRPLVGNDPGSNRAENRPNVPRADNPNRNRDVNRDRAFVPPARPSVGNDPGSNRTENRPNVPRADNPNRNRDVDRDRAYVPPARNNNVRPSPAAAPQRAQEQVRGRNSGGAESGGGRDSGGRSASSRGGGRR